MTGEPEGPRSALAIILEGKPAWVRLAVTLPLACGALALFVAAVTYLVARGSWLTTVAVAGSVMVAVSIAAVAITRQRGRPRTVESWQPAEAFEPNDAPAVYAAAQVVVAWREHQAIDEVSGQLTNPDGMVLARINDPYDTGVVARAWRFMDRAARNRRRRLVCRDPDDNPLFTVDVPETELVKVKTVTVRDAEQRPIGSIVATSANPFMPRYECRDTAGRVLARLQCREWMTSDLTAADREGTELARLVHHTATGAWTGKARVELRWRPEQSVHTMLLAAVISTQLLREP